MRLGVRQRKQAEFLAHAAMGGAFAARLRLRRLQLSPHQHELHQLLHLRRAVLLALLAAALLAACQLLSQRGDLLLQRCGGELKLMAPHRLELHLAQLLLEHAHLTDELRTHRCWRLCRLRTLLRTRQFSAGVAGRRHWRPRRRWARARPRPKARAERVSSRLQHHVPKLHRRELLANTAPRVFTKLPPKVPHYRPLVGWSVVFGRTQGRQRLVGRSGYGAQVR